MVYYWWFAIALVFFILEIATPGFVLLWFGVGGIVAGLLDLAGVHSLLIQVLVFGAVSFVMVILSRTIFKNLLMWKSPGADLKTNMDAMIDMTGIVTDEINNLASGGRILVQGQDWSARSENNEILPVNTRVMVIRFEGAKLIVRAIDAP
jgi:membrane protein implicated in regulation of membrane protease activity